MNRLERLPGWLWNRMLKNLPHMGSYGSKKQCSLIETIPSSQIAKKYELPLKPCHMPPGMTPLLTVGIPKEFAACESRCKNIFHGNTLPMNTAAQWLHRGRM